MAVSSRTQDIPGCVPPNAHIMGAFIIFLISQTNDPEVDEMVFAGTWV